tara:strand:+ start:237 stop:590 length:354 start_codon:yes stop_codon:yes gene_type:complete
MRLKEVGTGLKDMQALVGGFIEHVHIPQFKRAVHGYINEEGKLLKLPANVRASTIVFGADWHAWRDVIVGDMVLLCSNPQGGDRSINAEVAKGLLKLDRKGLLHRHVTERASGEYDQ